MAGVPDLVRRKKAFELYAQYKNVSKVSKELQIPSQTLFSWKKQDRWDEKLADLQAKLRSQQQVLDKAEEDLTVQADLDEVKMLETLQAEVADALLHKRVQINNWKDLISTLAFITKEKRLLVGAPTERNENKGEIDVTFMSEKDLDTEIDRMRNILAAPENEQKKAIVNE